MSGASPTTRPPQGDVHIAGALVHAHPSHLPQVLLHLRDLPHVEVRQQSADGRFVIVLEAASARAIVDTLDHIRSLHGVLNVALVYQHAEPAESMQQEMPT